MAGTFPRTARRTPAANGRVGPVRRRLFGSFVEHLGRCVYGGVFEPDHSAADRAGYRTDVLDLVRELGVTTVRYPGGNFVSGYRWEDGVGPLAERPVRLDTAWHSIEPNTFGLGDFADWAATTSGTSGTKVCSAAHPIGRRLRRAARSDLVERAALLDAAVLTGDVNAMPVGRGSHDGAGIDL
jgi:alpha-N-arabinofuranosidase